MMAEPLILYLDGELFTSLSGCVFVYCVESVILHILGEGVFSLWLVMSDVVVDQP
jgi:hypothetical protein